ncbi:probable membrane-associated kinase regulator 2 [Sesamum indicum]|uniref:Probable membrane-associated kinase regulator 2 n=1 Tax=Sesamum indicum TaxID=4182 RepID=A0A6I9SYN6_SESIN|nr:probable membrane-associated kinase regulator 2 [Sesamum indicum]
MEALGVLKFWGNEAAGADASSECDHLRNAAFGIDDEETDDDDSLFDLVFKSPDRGATKRDGASKKDSQFLESPRDVFLSKNDSSNSKPLSPVAILRSAPKFKVFMLGFKKSSKCEKTESSNGELKASPLNQLSKSSKLGQSNRFSVKCRVADVPVAPVFARDNSLRSKMLKESIEYEASSDVLSSEKSVPKYLKLIKPFYGKASKKTKSTDSVTPSSSPVTAPVNLSPKMFSEGSRIGSFKIVTRNLGKSRSASAAVGVVPPLVRRRDDSLLEQHDGIQGAILHCKKSYNSSSQEYSQLFRSASDPSHEKQRVQGRNSWEEQKRRSI